MSDKRKTKVQLIKELEALRHQLAERDAADDAHHQLQETLHRQTLTFEHMSDGVIVTDLQGQIVEWNPAAERMFGYAKAEVMGKTPAIVHRPGESSQLTARILDGVRREGRWSGEIHYRSKAGAEGICETVVVPLWSERGRIQGTVGVNRDITERKRAEDALQTAHDELETRVQERTAALAKTNTTLRAEITAHQQAAEALSRSQQQYAALVNSVNGIVWEADMQTQRFSFVGQQAERLLGYPLERWLREPDFWAEHMHPDDREWVFAFCEKAMWEQPAFQLRYRMLTAEGRTVWLQDSVNVIVENDHRVKLRGVIVDVSAQKQAEAILREAKEAAEAANRTKSEFLATMSHELRTPLNIIIGYVDLLLEGTFGPLAEKAQDSLQRVRNRAVELLELIVAMLDLSRLEAGRLPVEITEGRIPELLEELQAETQELEQATKLEFAWEVDTKMPPLYTDLGKLKIVLKNLIGNAVKFTDQGQISITAHNREGGVEIAVTDTGLGIPQAELAVIFEPFRQVDSSPTRQHGGTGLGLHIVKRLLELLGGRVSVESEVGRGTTFRVWIPAGR